jgi:lauroyl/myristoyl acyltransferase
MMICFADQVKTGLFQLWCFFRIWWTVGRRIPPWIYLYRCIVYQRKIRSAHRTRHGTRFISPIEAADIPDNASNFEHFSYSYQGLDEVKGMLAGRDPMVFITWHQGARGRNYGMAQAIADIAFFTRETYQYGKVFSYSMLGAKGLSLLKMDRFLRDGRPVRYAIDGPPLGNTIRLSLLGIPADFSTAPIRIMRSIKGLRVIPVTAYYRKGNAIEIIFHPPFPQTEALHKMSDRELLERLISYLERDLITQAPEQVRWRFIGRRKRLAKQR